MVPYYTPHIHSWRAKGHDYLCPCCFEQIFCILSHSPLLSPAHHNYTRDLIYESFSENHHGPYGMKVEVRKRQISRLLGNPLQSQGRDCQRLKWIKLSSGDWNYRELWTFNFQNWVYKNKGSCIDREKHVDYIYTNMMIIIPCSYFNLSTNECTYNFI